MKIEIIGLKKNYGNKAILNIEQMSLDRGKIIGLSGVNGAGKTTLLRIIAGLDSHYQGLVTYDGRSQLNNQLRQQITYLSQKPYRMLGTVQENISYPLRLRKAEGKMIEKKVRTLLEELGIQELSHQQANSLSGGEAQKMALARALVFEPKLLLLDEPTASIDAQTIEQIEALLIKRNREHQTTMILISHNREQLTKICDSLIELEGGSCIPSAL